MTEAPQTPSNREPEGPLLASVDTNGAVTTVRSESPKGLFHVLGSTLSSEVPLDDASSIIRGIYAYARRMQGGATQ